MLLNRPAILVVEDEPFIAMDVALAVEDSGGEVIGPAASISEALELLTDRNPCGAILDVNLPDGDITRVVECLVSRGVPMVIQTGIGLPSALAARFPDLVVVIKPVMATDLVRRLEALMNVSESNCHCHNSPNST